MGCGGPEFLGRILHLFRRDFHDPCMGWTKVVKVLGIPMGHHKRVNIIGYLIFWVLGAIYISFPAYCMMQKQRFCGWEADSSDAGAANLLNDPSQQDCVQVMRG